MMVDEIALVIAINRHQDAWLLSENQLKLKLKLASGDEHLPRASA